MKIVIAKSAHNDEYLLGEYVARDHPTADYIKDLNGNHTSIMKNSIITLGTITSNWHGGIIYVKAVIDGKVVYNKSEDEVLDSFNSKQECYEWLFSRYFMPILRSKAP